MYKQRLYTTAGIVLSFTIALGGWAFVSMLIDMKSDAMLSETGVVPVNAPRIEEDSDYDDESPFPTLTDYEIAAVLQIWQSELVYEQPHEPTEGQLSMEQAIKAGEDGLSYFFDQEVMPLEFSDHEYSKISAYLCRNIIRGKETQTFEPFYSTWSVSFSSENISAVFIINAVTGQIWGAAVEFTGNKNDEFILPKTSALLDIYTSYLNLEGGNRIEITDYSAQRDYNMFSAVVYGVSRGNYARISMGLIGRTSEFLIVES